MHAMQASMGVGLGLGRGVRGQRSSEIAKSRRRYHPEPRSKEVARQVQALIETTAGTVNCENGRSGSDVGIFDQSTGGIHHLATRVVDSRHLELMAKAGVDERGYYYQHEHETGKPLSNHLGYGEWMSRAYRVQESVQ